RRRVPDKCSAFLPHENQLHTTPGHEEIQPPRDPYCLIKQLQPELGDLVSSEDLPKNPPGEGPQLGNFVRSFHGQSVRLEPLLNFASREAPLMAPRFIEFAEE